jgi:hypothetical protein
MTLTPFSGHSRPTVGREALNAISRGCEVAFTEFKGMRRSAADALAVRHGSGDQPETGCKNPVRDR